MRRHVALFANVLCKIAERDTIDYAGTIVVPAFLNNTLIRSYGKTNFILHDVRFVTLDEVARPPIVGLSGYFVKDTELSREQLFDRREGLIKDSATMRSSPSAFFVLILNNHRLIYFPETTDAPNLDMFRATVLWRLKKTRKAYVDSLYKGLSDDSSRITKKKLYEAHPVPTLDVIPVSGNEEIRSFIQRYQVLKKIDFRLVRTNDEIDGEEMFEEVRKYLGSDIDSKSTKIIVANPQGLDKDAAAERVAAATATANQEVVLSGVDSEGNELKGDNSAFRVSSPIDNVPTTRSGLTQNLFSVFQHLVESGVIRIGEQRRNIADHIARLRDIF